jgi:hypothetical protein
MAKTLGLQHSVPATFLPDCGCRVFASGPWIQGIKSKAKANIQQMSIPRKMLITKVPGNKLPGGLFTFSQTKTII